MFSLLSLLDDVASTLDDVAVMTQLAIKKTSALMSDDLAVNAGVIDGVAPNKELKMVKAIFLGSLINKVYALSGVVFFAWLYSPLINVVMLIGGLYLSYEGVHKIIEKLFHSKKDTKAKVKKVDEASKIKGAIRTDLILSIEIIVIAKSSITGTLGLQILVLSCVGLLASILIYGLVALIVKIDDFGLYLIEKKYKNLGLFFVRSMPYIMKFLGIVGTAAMLLVGGGIIMHIFHLTKYTNEHLQNLILGFASGLVVLLILKVFSQITKKQVVA
jgi:predicted DNA repair protein MutK